LTEKIISAWRFNRSILQICQENPTTPKLEIEADPLLGSAIFAQYPRFMKPLYGANFAISSAMLCKIAVQNN
jgi:hypothetical protein